MSKTSNDIILKDIYNFYKANFVNNINYGKFAKIIDLFNKEVVQLLYKGLTIKLPYRLGVFEVLRSKPNYDFNEDGSIKIINHAKNIDWKATNKLWEDNPKLKKKKWLVYDNFHSDGYKVKVAWNASSKRFIFRTFNFKPSRMLVRGLATYIKTNNKIDYNDK